MVTLFESKFWYCEHSGVKSILGNSCFSKTLGFLDFGHFFCPFLNFSNTFAKQENPNNRYYLQSNLKKLGPCIENINAKIFINEKY